MGIFKKLTKAVVDTVALPIDVLSDVFSLSHKPTLSTEERLKKIREALGDAYEELDED